MADSLRDEVNDFDVRVLSVFPGRTATPLQRRIFEMEQDLSETLLQPDDVAALVVHTLGLPGTAGVADIHVRPMWKG